MQPSPSDPGPDFASALARAIQRRGATLATLSQQLQEGGYAVSPATLSYWQTGRSLPSRANSVKAVKVLEGLLDVPAGHLTRMLPSEAPEPWNPLAVFAERPEVAEAMRQVGIGTRSGQGYRTCFVEQYATVVEGCPRSEGVRQVFQVDAEELTHLAVVFGLAVEDDDLCPTPPARLPLVPLAGCRVGDRVDLPDGLSVVRLDLVPPIPQGELGMVEYRIDWLVEEPGPHSMARAVPDGLDYMVQSVSFEGGLPRTVRRHELPLALEEGEVDRVHTELATARFVQQAFSSPSAGATGLEWEF